MVLKPLNGRSAIGAASRREAPAAVLTHRAGLDWTPTWFGLRLCVAGPRYETSTFRNCHGSFVSMSSGNSPGRPVSGVQSV